MTDAEIAAAAAFLGLGVSEFIQSHTRLRADRAGLALEVGANGECTFLENGNCVVQPVKPQQCRDFPNLWNFPGFEKICRAIPRQVNEKDWRRLVAAATKRDPGSLSPPRD